MEGAQNDCFVSHLSKKTCVQKWALSYTSHPFRNVTKLITEQHLRIEANHQEVHVVSLESMLTAVCQLSSHWLTLLAFKDHTDSLRCQIVSTGLTWRVVLAARMRTWAVGLVAGEQTVQYGLLAAMAGVETL